MKKIFTLLVAVSSFTASFAQQSWSHEGENNRAGKHERSVTDSRWSKEQHQPAFNNQYNYKQNDHGYNEQRYNNRERQRQIDQINRECDQQVYSYEHDRSISNYERNRRVRQVESERSVRIGSFGTGAIIGAAAGIILGTILSH